MPKTHRWIVKCVTIVADTALVIFLLWFGITHNLFNWQGDWWYSLLTLGSVLGIGFISNWEGRED